MEVGRRRSTGRGGGVVAGSVWESRMKSDEVKGGIKVFNGDETSEEAGERKSRPKQSPNGVIGKRKTWKSENSDGFEKSPIQIARQRSDLKIDLDEQFKELSKSADGMIKKSPIQSKKTRSELSVSVDGIERSPIQKTRTRSEEAKEISVSVDRVEKKPVQIRKAKSESVKLIGQSPENSVQLRKVKPESNKGLGESVDVNERNSTPPNKGTSVSSEVLGQPMKEFDGLGDENDRNPIELKTATLESVETRSDETCKELDVCEEKVISSGLSNVGMVKSVPEMAIIDDVGDEIGDEEDDWDEELDDEIEIEEVKKRFEVKEIDITEQKPKTKQVVNEEKSTPISPIVKKQGPPLVNQSRTHPIPTKTKASPVCNGFQTNTGFQRIPETHNKLQSLVDLVMWRDVSKSAFVFGVGSFIIMSSSYTKDLNISFITVVSYLGLVYLAAIFLFRSIICRGVTYVDYTSQDYVVGEEEGVWLLKMVLPYLNEFLLKLRALFSGDPATTMKLAVLLFALARCGSSITIWKMAKLGFFGVFTLPKICSSYSTQLTAYGNFWVRRFKDAWESCSHKKAVGIGIFTLVWNLSSVVARIWAVFMLYVAFRYYQQAVMINDWVEEEPKCETSWQAPISGQRRGRGPTAVGVKKDKKRF
ncbi:Reticulon-like protein [Actinidia chinensis var. chinensis]|uniref:Reticulon-like protein n=1 Tax=Actinidia chinensis var. chinensis TaxID=1590841 RepID=A0A2R6QS75_ACTCC|nr:Reticulon-like protein [Actinidia chinensis var. chinensis]